MVRSWVPSVMTGFGCCGRIGVSRGGGVGYVSFTWFRCDVGHGSWWATATVAHVGSESGGDGFGALRAVGGIAGQLDDCGTLAGVVVEQGGDAVEAGVVQIALFADVEVGDAGVGFVAAPFAGLSLLVGGVNEVDEELLVAGDGCAGHVTPSGHDLNQSRWQ